MDNPQTDEPLESVAIIGMAGSFPGAENIAKFWRNLREGVESITVFEEDQHERQPWDDADVEYVKAKGVLEGAELFDAAFFGYTPAEARVMDPQHRLFLERGWEALEHAGYDADTYPGAIGVFAGVSGNSYLLTNLLRAPSARQLLLADKDFAATRLAYKLNLRGPAVVVQSACSTSLVAVCQACQSLLNYQCDLALAGGATVLVPTRAGYSRQPGGPLSPDGHCRAFDAQARGFVPGSGAGVVVLKRLSEAMEDGDSIAAVLKGFAVNNDGSAKVGYTAPSIDGQAEVIATAQALAGVDPETITYVEAHGTGTELGDPIEIAALTRAFRAATDKTGFCAVGSVKPNIGHLDAAAGVTGLIKTVLALQHREIPPSLNFEQPNPQIDFANSPFFVNDRLADWNPGSFPRRAGVSSFGIGGTNAHVVLEEAPAQSPGVASPPWQVLVLSAKTDNALDAATANLGEYLEQHSEANLADVAFTLQTGRRRFPHRRMLVCRDNHEARAALRGSSFDRMDTRVDEQTARQIVFMFPGQGAQYPSMARDLYEQQPVFRQAVDRCCDLLQPDMGCDLRQVMYPVADDTQAAERLTETSVAQPAIFVIEYALAQLWISWGVKPVACIGHSIGEYVAACLADVFDLEDALRLVAARARLVNRLPPGAMLAVRLSEEEAQRHVTGDIALAAINSPTLCVLSGPRKHIDRVESLLADRKVATIRLQASHAFHSSMMDPILDEYRRIVAAIGLRPPELPYVSNVTGTWIEKSQPTDPAHWVAHLRQTVRFAQGLECLMQSRGDAWLEVGPGCTLTSLARAHPACEGQRVVVASMRQERDTRCDLACLYRAAGQLWLGGVAVDWPAVHAPQRRRRIPLPTYPFQRQRYWATDEPAKADRSLRSTVSARGAGPSERFYAPSWRRATSPPLVTADSPKEDDHAWLLFVNPGELVEQVVDRLAGQGFRTVVVEPGSSFESVRGGGYRIHPQSAEDYRVLVQHLVQDGFVPQVVAHLWCATSYATPPADPASAGRIGFYSLVYLAQALGTVGVTSPVRMLVFTDGAQEVTGEERIVAEKALVQGPCRVLPQEFPHLLLRHIDLPLRTDASHGDAGVGTDTLVAELANSSLDPVVAYRHGHRWVQTYEPLVLEQNEDNPVPRLRPRGVYLVTGGLGGMGLVLAGWLADQVQARLVLTGRTALPERDTWPDWLADHEAGDPVSRRIRGVRALEETGADVLVLSADVCDRSQMQRVVEETAKRFGPIQGVIHAAGVAGGGIAQLKTSSIAESVLAPKVEGLRVVQRVVADQPLDFLALCSSLTSIVGGLGQVDYCAANAFMDAVAWETRSTGGPFVVAIDWTAWRDVGMAVETELPAHLRDLRTEAGLADSVSNAEGIDCFARILAAGQEPQIAVTSNDLPRVLQHQLSWSHEMSMPQATGGDAGPRPDLKTLYVEPQTETERTVAGIWQDVFGFEPIGTQDDFFELGGHSLMALQMLERLRIAFAVNMALDGLFNNKTIKSLSGYIDSALWVGHEETGSTEAAPGREEITL